MYTVVRLNSIFRKLGEREGRGRGRPRSPEPPPALAGVRPRHGGRGRRALGPRRDRGRRFEEEVLHSVGSLEFSHLAKFAFLLSQKANAYYHRRPVLAEENADIKNVRIWVLDYVRGILAKALGLMGLDVPERM